MPSYLVTGAGGQLGQCFQSVAAEFPQHHLLFTKRSEVDINQPETLENFYAQSPFEGIINCAAYTQVDQAETEFKEAHQVNTQGVENLSVFAEAKNIRLIHFSTDFVFDGTKKTPYLEADSTNPLSVYGKSKLAGERILNQSNCQFVCFRVSWLFSPFGKNFVKTILNASQSKSELGVVEGQFGKPTYGLDLARSVVSNLDHPQLYNHPIYHFAQGSKTNWYEFAAKIIALAGSPCKVKPIASFDFPTAAKRPLNSALDTQRIEKTLSLSIPTWETALVKCVKQIQKNEVI
ncbi:dTDP-4-dehydrorhamnose reductase [Flavobacteriaceae bacterium]|nr:dTDP-4-dehydrorhamnose reductase [Flavobacteriaceae bacterium]